MATTALVHKGGEFPPYIADAVGQFYAFNPGKDLYLIVDRDFEEARALASRFPGFRAMLASELRVSKNHARFVRWSGMKTYFRRGLWRYAVERFFILEDLMETLGIERLLHFEYDNLVYFELDRLEEAFAATSAGISLPADSTERCIPSIVFVKEKAALADFCRSYIGWWLLRKTTDMAAFSLYAKKRANRCSYLPVVPSSYKEGRSELRSSSGIVGRDVDMLDRGFERFGGIFDAAAFGQYLGGVDPRNSATLGPGFINETALYSPADFILRWAPDEKNRLVPLVTHGGREFPIYNLHVHSKNLASFRSDRALGAAG